MDFWPWVLLLVACPVAHLLAMRLASRAPSGQATADLAGPAPAARQQDGGSWCAGPLACLNGRALAAVGGVVVLVWLVAPRFALPVLLVLLALACPLLMILGLRGVPGAGSCHTSSAAHRAGPAAAEAEGEHEGPAVR